MNPDLIRAAASKAANARAEVFGVELEFRGETVRGVVTPQDPSSTLETGGFREEAEWRIRLPATIQPPPAINEEIYEPGSGRTFYVRGCIPGNLQNPLAAEHLVGASLS